MTASLYNTMVTASTTNLEQTPKFKAVLLSPVRFRVQLGVVPADMSPILINWLSETNVRLLPATYNLISLFNHPQLTCGTIGMNRKSQDMNPFEDAFNPTHAFTRR